MPINFNYKLTPLIDYVFLQIKGNDCVSIALSKKTKILVAWAPLMESLMLIFFLLWMFYLTSMAFTLILTVFFLLMMTAHVYRCNFQLPSKIEFFPSKQLIVKKGVFFGIESISETNKKSLVTYHKSDNFQMICIYTKNTNKPFATATQCSHNNSFNLFISYLQETGITVE